MQRIEATGRLKARDSFEMRLEQLLRKDMKFEKVPSENKSEQSKSDEYENAVKSTC